ncbi:MAG: hypothetical protein AB201_01140 [Parcubacteria bacterium C7867-006]|nr:MAG: hypothetical protein AB201_01140 [Parcubacteria bacterium C7867-006]
MLSRLFLFFKNQFFGKSLLFLGVICLFVFSYSVTFAITPEEQDAIWRAELAQTEADIAKWQSILNSTQANTKSLQQEAALLNAKIKEAQATIKKKNIAIQQLGVDIQNRVKKISDLENKIEKGHESLAQLIRQTNEIDQSSLPEVVLGNKDISDFFADVDSFQMIKRSLKELFAEIRDTKNLTEKEKEALDKKKDQELDTKASIEAQKKAVEANEKEKQYLITVNKTQEKTYSQVIADRQAKANEIRAKLFKLAGGGAAIPFGTALVYAQNASAKTGVSPAFVLAILTQESNLGANVGKCYVTDLKTGTGVNTAGTKTFSNVMKAPRDTVPFVEILNNLGYSTEKTVVSCPIAGVAGYGGAMGPAQFIPSTWKIFEDRLLSVLGHNANPWNPEDAFMASAMYLGDLGAGSGTYSGEIKAACRYYGSGGTSCSYGKSVMKLKDSIQADIEYLQQYGISRR